MNKPLTQNYRIGYGDCVAGDTRQWGLAARFVGGHSAVSMADFLSVACCHLFGRPCGRPSGLPVPTTGLLTRMVRPFCLAAKKAGNTFSVGGILCPIFISRCPAGSLCSHFSTSKEGVPMQLKSHMTEDTIRNNKDPLSFACHAMSKLKMVSAIICNESCMIDSVPFEAFRAGEVYAMGQIIEDAADELQFLMDVAQMQISKIKNLVRELEVQA